MYLKEEFYAKSKRGLRRFFFDSFPTIFRPSLFPGIGGGYKKIELKRLLCE